MLSILIPDVVGFSCAWCIIILAVCNEEVPSSPFLTALSRLMFIVVGDSMENPSLDADKYSSFAVNNSTFIE